MKVTIPNDQWDEGKEGVIVTWIYGDGAEVEVGDVICELMVEKIQSDFVAPASGVLRILVEADSTVEPGDHVADIE
ncbi:lipoyl domain-containing protein [Shewanella corallii]|uniref:Lipoyl domain-containing protein n=1 Tax=Shewanella corallii TaxID=560080 RepID=A0ABT0NAL3_9GAMM|nr:lipoyl domain-containing protein [Shewanella corallii]MCL2915492.1 lipoyl domain-containing protein [Shewanella corallii]